MAGPPPTRLSRAAGGLPILTMSRDAKAWARVQQDLAIAAAGIGDVSMRAMRVVTRWLQRQVKTGITRGLPGGRPLKRNAQATIRRKGSARPLLDSGTLRNSLTRSVTRRGRVVTGAVGIIKYRQHPSGRGRTVARVAMFAEFGFNHVTAGRFIRRRFLMPVLVREAGEIQRLFARAFSAGAARRLRIRGPIRPNIVRGIVRA